jgi:hypothetical protein
MIAQKEVGAQIGVFFARFFRSLKEKTIND